MNPALVLMYAMQVLQALPALIEAGQNVKLLVETVNTALQKMQAENRDPSPEEWDALNKVIADLRAQLHAPRPPA